MKPLDAKRYFQFQTPYNIAIVLLIFIPCAILVAKQPYVLLADAGLIALLYCFYFFYLDGHAIGIECPNCKGRIESNTPWVCGFCSQKNQSTGSFPFLKHCEHCEAEPKAYKCHHCGELVFLSKDTLKANFACCLNLQKARASSDDDEKERGNARAGVLHDIEMAQLKAKLDELKKRENLGKRTEAEKIEEDFWKYATPRISKEEFARKRLAINAEVYKNDPEMRERADAVVMDWLRSSI